MKVLSSTIAPIAIFSLALPAQAGKVTYTYEFTVKVTQGSLAGNTFEGTFSYDSTTLTHTGAETIGVEDELDITMQFLGQIYEETADTDYPNFPQLILQDGEVQQLDFWMEAGPRVNWWALPGWKVQLSEPSISTTLCLNPSCD